VIEGYRFAPGGGPGGFAARIAVCDHLGMDPTQRPPASVISSLDVPETPAVPRDSATVLVARDGAHGLEVFMLKRHLNSDTLGGAFVFPGGTVDAGDGNPELADRVAGVDDDLHRALGAQALGLIVCAIRETFEEAGVLLARTRDGAPVRLENEQRWIELRRALNAREIDAMELARAGDVIFAADLLRYWQRLITPVQAHKRYDTRFFVAHLPDGQVPLHDDYETTESEWVRPADAVARGRAGEFSIIYPTRKTLESIDPFADAASLFAAARGRPADAITPRIVVEGGEARIVLPDGTSDAP
jgi:8-oxo-dGTP pyrophosphatase MutT (NUDIX family)